MILSQTKIYPRDENGSTHIMFGSGGTQDRDRYKRCIAPPLKRRKGAPLVGGSIATKHPHVGRLAQIVGLSRRWENMIMGFYKLI
jgi:hypothetical protein